MDQGNPLQRCLLKVRRFRGGDESALSSASSLGQGWVEYWGRWTGGFSAGQSPHPTLRLWDGQADSSGQGWSGNEKHGPTALSPHTWEGFVNPRLRAYCLCLYLSSRTNPACFTHAQTGEQPAEGGRLDLALVEHMDKAVTKVCSGVRLWRLGVRGRVGRKGCAAGALEGVS